MKHKIKILIFLFSFSANNLFSQMEKKEHEKLIGKPGEHYTYTMAWVDYNPKTFKNELISGKWKKQPKEYVYKVSAFREAKHREKIFGSNFFNRIFKLRKKIDKPEIVPATKEKEKVFTSGEKKRIL